MFRSSFKTLLLLSAGLLFAVTTLADPQIGQLLEEAMAARKTEFLQRENSGDTLDIATSAGKATLTKTALNCTFPGQYSA